MSNTTDPPSNADTDHLLFLKIARALAAIEAAGPGGTPGGSNGEVQYNNNGALGGVSGGAAGQVLSYVAGLPVWAFRGLIGYGFAQNNGTFTTTSTSFTDITNLTLTYTPKSASSIILLRAMVTAQGTGATNSAILRLARDGTGIGVAAAAGSRIQASARGQDTSPVSAGIEWVDSYGSTTAATWSVQLRVDAAGTAYINRSAAFDSDSATTARFVSSLTLMEILIP